MFSVAAHAACSKRESRKMDQTQADQCFTWGDFVGGVSDAMPRRISNHARTYAKSATESPPTEVSQPQ